MITLEFSLLPIGKKKTAKIESLEQDLLQAKSTMERLEHELELSKLETQTSQQLLEGIGRSFAVIEFELDGTILKTNKNFQDAMGYSNEEVCGKHHSMFATKEYAQSDEYKEMWAKLKRGEFISGEFHRIANNNRDIWLQASYNPIYDQNGTPIKVVKFAMDVTEEKRRNVDFQSQIESLHRSQAVIEFNLDGTIVTANENFLSALGYQQSEIQGRHHRMFVENDYSNSPEYQQFWDTLRSGKFHSGQFKRIKKSGEEIWIDASYNPIFDPTGKLIKVVKFATDITSEVRAKLESSEASGTLASSVTEMAATITEISKNVGNVTNLSKNTQNLTDSTSEVIAGLEESSHKIVNVVALISKFASQTNLLSLNASVEAARAGEAGKGFAVVAVEVKSLAEETRKATDDISECVEEIRDRVEKVIESSGKISTAVKDVNHNITGVASAIEQQSATMCELEKTAEKLAEISQAT